jgi:hypothetical protein
MTRPTRPGRAGRPALVVLAALTAPCAGAGAQNARPDTMIVQAGPHYAAGGLHRLLFGADYRALWTAPLAVEVLDLRTYAGGLTPTTAGGGFQTKSLRFRGGDGHQYGFRSVDKDPAVLPPGFEGTFIEDLVSDQTSSQHPYAVSVVPALLGAAGILHTEPRLVVLPDDPALGEFRERFANTLGYIERRAIVEVGRPGFAGALGIVDDDEFFSMTARGPDDRVDGHALLLARLFDFWIGDWDRHPGQWTYARFSDTTPRVWTPIPEDRDQAFARFDGLMLGIARQTAPFLLKFGPSYGNPVGAGWNGRELDRRFLTYLPDTAWDSLAAALAARLPDSVIDAAVRYLPPEVHALDGERLARILKRRRDALPAFARRMRATLLGEAELHATDAAEAVTIAQDADGRVTVTLAAVAHPTSPYLERVFDPALTRDLRIYLHGGADRVSIRGTGGRIRVRLVGGGGAVVTDSSTARPVTVYAAPGDEVTGPGRARVDRRADVGPAPERPYRYYRDWGAMWQPTGWLAYGPDVGIFAGPGAQRTDFGFRAYPFAMRTRVRAGWAFGAETGRADLDLEIHRENSRVRTVLYTRASGIEVVRYSGPGNETELTEEDEYYRVRQQQYLVLPAVVLPLGPRAELGIGPSAEFIQTRDDDGRIVDVTGPYGGGSWGQFGARAQLTWDSRDDPRYPTSGVFGRVAGALFPTVLDVDSAYGYVDGALAAYVSARGVPGAPTLALRVGGRKVWGPYPFFASAFIGDAASARLGRQHRYGGDASAYGNAELRLRLTRFFVLLPGELGIFGLADAGRVFLEGETSDRWHGAFGGGIWVSLLQHTTVLSAAIARSSELTRVYVSTGMAF